MRIAMSAKSLVFVHPRKIYDHAYPLQVMRRGETKPCVLAGPTCDSIDIVAEGIELPALAPVDLVLGHEIGGLHSRDKNTI